MGSNNSTLSRIPNADVLMQETGFTPAHIIRLYDRFETLDSDKKGYLSQKDFESIKALALNPIGDRIIGAFFTAGQETVDFHSFVRILAHFRPVDKSLPRDPEAINSRTNKLRFAFQLYDQDRDGKISRAELLQVLRMMMEMQVTEEQLDSIVDRSFMESDLDGDDGISFDEFRKSLDRLNIDHKMSIRFLTLKNHLSDVFTRGSEMAPLSRELVELKCHDSTEGIFQNWSVYLPRAESA